jgi:hypothetical protein
MKTMKYIIASVLFFSSLSGLAQTKEDIMAQAEEKNVFEKKLRFGLSWNQYWGTIKGSNLPKEYFAKPCVGASLRAEYYPLSFVGIGVGFGVQQRGAGIINEDKTGGTFSHPWFGTQDNTEDSTYRQRLRMNTIEVPVTLLLRTPRDVIKGVRLTGAAGIVWIKNDYVKDFWHKPEDGFHTIINVEDDYIKQDLGYQASVGADIDAGQSVFQVHFVYTKGTKNIYTTGSGDGRVETYGFRVSWLY